MRGHYRPWESCGAVRHDGRGWLRLGRLRRGSPPPASPRESSRPRGEVHQVSPLMNMLLPNKRLKLTGPALNGVVRLLASELTVDGRVLSACQRMPRSLSAVR